MLCDVTSAIEPLERILDFGCGDGWFAHKFIESQRARELIPLDVKRRRHTWVEPQIYQGGALPFPDASFDMVYSVDVLHHCPDPVSQLAEVARCAKRFILLKDHTYTTTIGRYALALLDEVGNRRFGIPSLYQYQKKWMWHDYLLANGWKVIIFIHPAPCHTGLLGMLTNQLQYVALYERE